VLINLARVSRLDLLGQIQDMLFHAPQEVLNEVTELGQMTKVEEAIKSGAQQQINWMQKKAKDLGLVITPTAAPAAK
jgi:hypothetical protein